MFYRGFDGPLLRERFLEGNDTHEIKLILAVSRNANAQRAKFNCGRKGLEGAWTGCRLGGEGCGLEGAGLQKGGANRRCSEPLRPAMQVPHLEQRGKDSVTLGWSRIWKGSPSTTAYTLPIPILLHFSQLLLAWVPKLNRTWSYRPEDREVKGKRTSQQIIHERVREGRETLLCLLPCLQATAASQLLDGRGHCFTETTPRPASLTPPLPPHTSSWAVWVSVFLKAISDLWEDD